MFGSKNSNYLWMLFIALLISMINLILGAICLKKGMKTTKNIVIGIVFTVLLCIFGTFSITFGRTHSHSLSYIDTIGSVIHFDLPSQGFITTHSFEKGTANPLLVQKSVEYYYESKIKFINSKQVLAFKETINKSDLWTMSIATPLLGLMPQSYAIDSAGFDHFMLYNVDLNTYNTIPNKSGIYHFIFLAFESSDSKMLIGDYSYDIVLQ